MIGQDDHLGRARDGRLDTEAHVLHPLLGGDRAAARQLDELGEVRVAARHEQRIGPQDVEHARNRPRLHGGAHGVDAAPDAVDERGHRGLTTGQLADTLDEVVHLGHAVGVHDVDGNAEPPQLQEGLLAVALVGADDEIGPERDDRLEARVDHPAHARLEPCRRRPVAEVAHADEPVLAAHGERALGDARYERDDARRRGGQRHLAAEHVAQDERLCGRRQREQHDQRHGADHGATAPSGRRASRPSASRSSAAATRSARRS